MTLLPARRYTAAWRVDVRTTNTEVKIYVIKEALPPALQNRRGNVPDESTLLVGTLEPKDPHFDARLDALIDKANGRATSLSLTQNSYNQYDIRMAMLMHKRWKWILGTGIVIGMALPNLPLVPII